MFKVLLIYGMNLTKKIGNILHNYRSETVGVRQQLAKFLMHGKLSGTGKLCFLAVDQGFEHGADRSFAMNPDAYDPDYHFRLAKEAGLSGYAAPIGWLEAAVDDFLGEVPLILKMNNSNSLLQMGEVPDQAITSSVQDALRLGCSAVGFTIYPGSVASIDQFEEIAEIIQEAKSCGLAVIVWSYPRGDLEKKAERALDVISYGAHMAALLGANIIKVKLPTDVIALQAVEKVFAAHQPNISTMADRVAHVVKNCFNGKRMVIFSGMEAKSDADMMEDAKAIRLGKGFGSIIGRNCFQRNFDDAIDMLRQVANIYLEK